MFVLCPSRPYFSQWKAQVCPHMCSSKPWMLANEIHTKLSCAGSFSFFLHEKRCCGANLDASNEYLGTCFHKKNISILESKPYIQGYVIPVLYPH